MFGTSPHPARQNPSDCQLSICWFARRKLWPEHRHPQGQGEITLDFAPGGSRSSGAYDRAQGKPDSRQVRNHSAGRRCAACGRAIVWPEREISAYQKAAIWLPNRWQTSVTANEHSSGRLGTVVEYPDPFAKLILVSLSNHLQPQNRDEESSLPLRSRLHPSLSASCKVRSWRPRDSGIGSSKGRDHPRSGFKRAQHPTLICNDKP
jgi:hypothetical protein